MKPHRIVSLSLSFSFATTLAFWSGCADSPRGSPEAPARQSALQPSLAGDSAFFGGAVSVHVALNSAVFGSNPGSKNERKGTPQRVGGATTDEMANYGTGLGGGGDTGLGSHGGGGMGRGGGGGYDGPHYSDTPNGSSYGYGNSVNSSMGGDDSGGGGGGGANPGTDPNFAPIRQIMRVSFANQGKEPAELSIVEVNSVLGNFAPRPEHLALEAGQTQSLNEMRASAENLEELDVQITLSRKNARETKTVHLARAPQPSSAPGPAAPPPPKP